ncbi:hypothetical protein [Paraburkholderia sp. BR14320]|uniref:hypothetical protein n=1 Tax=unclassified Paraburkholderia TaxID=2615204 RepID=UPI0034CE9D27
MTFAEHETTHALSVESDGVNYAGTYRIMTGTVVVHFSNESKFVSYAPNRP